MTYEVQIDLGILGEFTATVEAKFEDFGGEDTDVSQIRNGDASVMISFGGGDIEVSDLVCDVAWDDIADQVRASKNEAKDQWPNVI